MATDWNENTVRVYLRRNIDEPQPKLGDRITVAVSGHCLEATCCEVMGYEQFWSACFKADLPLWIAKLRGPAKPLPECNGSFPSPYPLDLIAHGLGVDRETAEQVIRAWEHVAAQRDAGAVV